MRYSSANATTGSTRAARDPRCGCVAQGIEHQRYGGPERPGAGGATDPHPVLDRVGEAESDVVAEARRVQPHQPPREPAIDSTEIRHGTVNKKGFA